MTDELGQAHRFRPLSVLLVSVGAAVGLCGVGLVIVVAMSAATPEDLTIVTVICCLSLAAGAALARWGLRR